MSNTDRVSGATWIDRRRPFIVRTRATWGLLNLYVYYCYECEGHTKLPNVHNRRTHNGAKKVVS